MKNRYEVVEAGTLVELEDQHKNIISVIVPNKAVIIYARYCIRHEKEKDDYILMHRVLMGEESKTNSEDNLVIHHKIPFGLINIRDNLGVTTVAENNKERMSKVEKEKLYKVLRLLTYIN